MGVMITFALPLFLKNEVEQEPETKNSKIN